ncbi:MAG: secretin N-terminal domain-containing protein [Gammaproteobacteria bacterium]|nr:secretin N-terminal domain-containing protein [Gammaproteobacteria bacterium]
MRKIFIILLLFIPFSVISKPLALNFNDIPIRQALQFIAEASHLNVIVSDKVKGNITIHLDNLTPQQAMTVILQEAGLGEQLSGNVILISPLQELAQKEKTQQDLLNFAPLHSLLIKLRYAKANDIATSIKTNTLLSSRGSLSTDPRTNTVWVQDIPNKLNAIHSFIRSVDVPVKQVLIEARIVSVDEKYERELGIRFESEPTQKTDGLIKHFSVDLPTTNPHSASIGIALAKLGDGNLLDLELSALETQGMGEVISSPRLLTANQQSATILSGQEIPYQQATSSGATSISFQKALLNLVVTPQITPDQKLILTLHLSQDQPTTTLIKGVPVIETRQLQTLVTVKNRQTVVLGGIYEQNNEKIVGRVPFLSKIPIIGSIFTRNITKKDRRELLIFITPSITKG